MCTTYKLSRLLANGWILNTKEWFLKPYIYVLLPFTNNLDVSDFVKFFSFRNFDHVNRKQYLIRTSGINVLCLFQTELEIGDDKDVQSIHFIFKQKKTVTYIWPGKLGKPTHQYRTLLVKCHFINTCYLKYY